MKPVDVYVGDWGAYELHFTADGIDVLPRLEDTDIEMFRRDIMAGITAPEEPRRWRDMLRRFNY